MTAIRSGIRTSRLVIRLHTSARRQLLIIDLDWIALVRAVPHRMIGRRVWWVRRSIRRDSASALARGLGLKPIALEDLPQLRLDGHTYDAPAYAAFELVQDLDLDEMFRRLASGMPDPDFAASIMRIGLLQELLRREVDLSIVDQWLRQPSCPPLLVVAASWWDREVLNRMHPEARIVVWGRGVGLRSLLGRAWRLVRTALLDRRIAVPAASATTQASRAGPVSRRLIQVFNQDDHYGRLYAYDYLRSDEPTSPLNPQNISFVSASGGFLASGFRADAYPGTGTVRQRWERERRHRRTLRGSWHWQAVAWAARFAARAEGASTELRGRYPHARLAYLTYEIQVPATVSLGLHLAGIPTVALLERPESAVVHSSPFAVRTLLTPSPDFAARASRSFSIASVEVRAAGMWRTDLLISSRSSPAPKEVQRARAEGRRTILVLPFHVTPPPHRPSEPVLTAPGSMAHFMGDIAFLALQHSDCHFIIRGKNDDWVDDPRLKSVIDELATIANIEVNREYQALNESYLLCAHADIVIAKPTSLAEECLAIGVPCILHDYTPNTSGYIRANWTHLPREIWALDRVDLNDRFAFARDADGAAFRIWWEPFRAGIYGGLNNGRVRERVREVVRSMVEDD